MDYSHYSYAQTLDELTPGDRTELEIAVIRESRDEFADALFGDPRFIEGFTAALTHEREASACYNADHGIRSAIGLNHATCGLGEWVRDRVLVYLAERMEAGLAQAWEDAQPGLTVEREDNLLRARDMIAGWR